MRGELTQWTEPGRSRTWQSPCEGGEGGANRRVNNHTQSKQDQVTYRPEVVNQNVEYTQQDHQQNSAPLGLESHNDHDTRHKPEQANNHAPQAPLTGKHEADKKEDQEHPTGKLDVHLAVFLIKLGQAGGHELLAHPRVRQHHEQASDDTQIAEEEVKIEDETVTEALGDDHAEQAEDGIFRLFAGDDQEGAYRHGDNVEDKEGMREAPWDWRQTRMLATVGLKGG